MRPQLTWQDGLSLCSIFFAFALARAEDLTFLITYTALACVCAVVGIWSHREFSIIIKFGICCFVALIFISLDASQFRSLRAKELLSSYGNLISAGEAQPLSNCAIPIGAIAIYAGQSAVWGIHFPFTAFKMGNYDLVTISKGAAGDLLVDANIFDDRENLIAKIAKNKYRATSYSSDYKRIDRSSFAVYDHLNRVALEVRFVNNTAIRITGIFHSPGSRREVVVTKDQLLLGTTTINGYCAGNAGRAAFAF